MGCCERRAMVLLSTLAALVILVHSHEEEMESYRELGPGHPQPQPSNLDQTWRAVRSEPIAQTEDWDENSPEEAPRRKRPGRKRKRRPQAAIANEPEERRFYHEEPPRTQDSEYSNAFENPDMPRRRRKRPEMRNNNWADQPPEQERPLRRRGQRRKRPIRPKQAESEVLIPDEKLVETEDRPFKEDKAASFINHKYDENDETYSKPYDKPNSDEVVYDLNAEGGNKEVFVETERPVEVRLPEAVEEKSVTDISKEDDDFKTASGPIKPKTLKDILKKSNGFSLSEILQQHNLSLTDLLHGKENAISLLKTDDIETKPEEQNENDRPTQFKLPTESEVDSERTTESQPTSTEPSVTQQKETMVISDDVEKEQSVPRVPELLHANEDKPKMLNRRRYSGGRRKLRLKTPMRNGTIKFPGNKEYLSANARRLLHQSNFATLRINMTSSTTEANTISTVNDNTIATVEVTTATNYPEEKTTQENAEEKIPQELATTVTEQPFSTTVNDNTDDETKATTQDYTTTTVENRETDTMEPLTETIFFTTTEKVVTTPIVKAKQLNTSELRRQALTNRLKKKRLKQKTLLASTTESSIDNLTKDLYGMSNLVSASEFIAKVQTPKTTKPQFNLETTLEDFMATEASSTSRRTSHYPSSRITAASKATSPIVTTTTEEIAKFEIEEILNDTDTGARLSKILIERNMTIDELVEHRERGSSNIHLADIFHNTSREPNPGEPFLSKSSIEPISKETYPLRALLEANSHELKPTTIEPYFAETRYPNIPVVMDFGSNVNENGENLGIVSLFHKMAGNVDHKVDSKQINKDSEGTPYISTILVDSVNSTNSSDSNPREGRQFVDKHGTVSLHDIISMTHMNYNKNETKATSKAFTLPTTAKTTLEDADDVIIMDNMQNLQDSHIAPESDENVELNLMRRQNTPTEEPGILDKIPSHTKSVTVATASILGLSMVVFLLTYATFKWRQQRCILRKKNSFCEDKIPSPVFESRKGTKNQSSTRSISPMISSTNIYTMSTLDSRNGKESPDYMWDSLRKPFQ